MPNNQICLYGFDKAEGEGVGEKFRKKILAIMQSLECGGDAITDVYVFDSETSSCDGRNTPMPYVRIKLFSSEPEHVPAILAGFQLHGAHVDVEEVGHKNRFFSKEEVASGEWRKKFAEKPHVIVEISGDNAVFTYGPFDSAEKAEAEIIANGFSGVPGGWFEKNGRKAIASEILPLTRPKI